MHNLNEPSAANDDSANTQAFLRLFVAHQQKILTHILAMVPNRDDAEEILQNTSVALWKSFGDFEIGTNFKAWAFKAAYHQVLAFRKRHKRTPVFLSNEFIEAVAVESIEMSTELDDRLQAMSRCIARLRSRDRSLLKRYYQSDATIKDIACDLGRPVGSISKTLTRIRRMLLECIGRALGMEGHI